MRRVVVLCAFLVVAGCTAPGAWGESGPGELQVAIRRSDLILVPQGPGPFPAVIMLHGCGGLGSRDRMWAERLREWGYLTLRVNSVRRVREFLFEQPE